MKIRTLIFLSCLFIASGLFAGSIPLDSLIQYVGTRFEAYVDYDTFSVSVVSATKQMDNEWQPIEVYSIEKKMTVKGKEVEEEFVKAIKEKKGEETDITEQVREEQKKAKEKAERRNKKKEEKNNQGEDEENGQFSLDLKDIFPFDESKRNLFEFCLLPDTVFFSRAAYNIGVKVKEISEKRYGGKYYFDKETYDLLFMDVKPSKNPKFVKEFNIRMWFNVLDNQYLILTQSWMRIFASILIKKVRVEIKETYSDYQIVPSIIKSEDVDKKSQ